MRLALLVVAGLALLPALAAADKVEDALAGPCGALPNLPVVGDPRVEVCKVQYDGGRHGDASDVCDAPAPDLARGESTTGIALPVDDPQDDYALFLPAGAAVTVRLQPSPLLAGLGLAPLAAPDYDLTVYEPGCRAGSFSNPSGGSMGEEVAFVAAKTGTYTVQVRVGGLGGLGIGVPGMGVEVCHPFCIATLNALYGYGLYVS